MGRLSKVFRLAIKFAPIVYPIAKKLLKKRKMKNIGLNMKPK